VPARNVPFKLVRLPLLFSVHTSTHQQRSGGRSRILEDVRKPNKRSITGSKVTNQLPQRTLKVPRWRMSAIEGCRLLVSNVVADLCRVCDPLSFIGQIGPRSVQTPGGSRSSTSDERRLGLGNAAKVPEPSPSLGRAHKSFAARVGSRENPAPRKSSSPALKSFATPSRSVSNSTPHGRSSSNSTPSRVRFAQVTRWFLSIYFSSTDAVLLPAKVI